MKQTIPHIKHCLKYESPPHFLVLHVGGNDIGQYHFQRVRANLLSLLDQLQALLPNTILIWSQILPRLEWRHEICHKALEKCRIRLNSMAAFHVINRGGRYIRYPELNFEGHGLYCDQVHLCDMGNELFLYRLQHGLQTFMSSSLSSYPPKEEYGPWLVTPQLYF